MIEDSHLMRFYVHSLTPRQRDVLQLVSEGLKNREIAERLHISTSVVAEHLSNIYSLLGVLDGLNLNVCPNRYVAVRLFAEFFERHPEMRVAPDQNGK
jgi:DNA-binding NarL/FixJ family response regulator